MAKLHVRCVAPFRAAALAWLLPVVASVASKSSVVKVKQGIETSGAAPASVPADAPAPAPTKPCFKKMPLKAQEQGFDGKMVIHQDGQSHTSDWMKEYGANVKQQVPPEKPVKQELSDAEKAANQKVEKNEEEPRTKAKSETQDKKEKEDNKPSSILDPPEDLKPAVPTVPIPGLKSFGVRAIGNLWAVVAVAATSSFMS